MSKIVFIHMYFYLASFLNSVALICKVAFWSGMCRMELRKKFSLPSVSEQVFKMLFERKTKFSTNTVQDSK